MLCQLQFWKYQTTCRQLLILALFCFVVDKNGDVCISILHEPGEDKYGYEKPEERWLPIHTVETIMISVISMLADPNGDSPANVDAAVRFSLICQLFSVQKPKLAIEFCFQLDKQYSNFWRNLLAHVKVTFLLGKAVVL